MISGGGGEESADTVTGSLLLDAWCVGLCGAGPTLQYTAPQCSTRPHAREI